MRRNNPSSSASLRLRSAPSRRRWVTSAPTDAPTPRPPTADRTATRTSPELTARRRTDAAKSGALRAPAALGLHHPRYLRALTLRRPLNFYPARFFRGKALGHDLAARQHLRSQCPRHGLCLLEDGANSAERATSGLDPVLRRTGPQYSVHGYHPALGGAVCSRVGGALRTRHPHHEGSRVLRRASDRLRARLDLGEVVVLV